MASKYVRNKFLPVGVAVLALLVAASYHARVAAFEYLGSQATKWDPGPNSSSFHGFVAPAGPGLPGAATWSAMPSGVPFSSALGGSEEVSGGGRHPDGDVNIDIEFLITPEVDGLEYAIFNEALNVWAAAAGFTNLGQVADGATLGPGGAVGDPDSLNGHLGDIRVGSFAFTGVDPDLVEAFQPGNDIIFGGGGNIAGDIHFNRNLLWIDDAEDPSAGNDYDFFTIALHEIGHALGLGHSDVEDSVMHDFYVGSRRSLHPDDIAGIIALYGPIPEPSAGVIAVIGMLLAGAGRRPSRRRR